MTHQKNDTQDENESQVSFEAMLREKLQQAVRTALISVLEAEVDAFIGAMRYQPSRAAARLSQRTLCQRSGHDDWTY
jgi:transposase-like protein